MSQYLKLSLAEIWLCCCLTRQLSVEQNFHREKKTDFFFFVWWFVFCFFFKSDPWRCFSCSLCLNQLMCIEDLPF